MDQNKIAAVLFVLSIYCNVFFAQVTHVDYYLEFNQTSFEYEVNIIIAAGSATTSLERSQFNAGISIVVPTGESIQHAENFMPLQNNSFYTGTVPMQWELSDSVISPIAQPLYDFYNFIPDLFPAAFYNNLMGNDTIKIFSFTVGNGNECFDEVRFYDNDIDPGALEPGMEGKDFTNYFMLGSPSSIFDCHNEEACDPSEEELEVILRVYLEGALLHNGNEIGDSHGRPLMRDDLRLSPFNGMRYIPNTDPYSNSSILSWEDLSLKYQHVCPGAFSLFRTVADPDSIFSVTGENAIVDWVFVELRAEDDATRVVSTRSALLQRDGDVVDLDGVSPLAFPGVPLNNYYVVVKHRNHLGAMTANPITPTQLKDLVDFSDPNTDFFDFGTTKVAGVDYTGMAQRTLTQPNGMLALWAGDFNGDGKVKLLNSFNDSSDLLSDIYGYEIRDVSGNTIGFNFLLGFANAFGYQSGDFDLDSRSKYNQPMDDRNMLIAQHLLYPLNESNSTFYNFFIEQIPN